MQIKITGGTASQKKHVRAMTEFCIKKLMPRMKDLYIHVKLVKLEDAYGYCLSNDEQWHDRPRTFEIELQKGMRLRRLLEVLAHELVHVKQYARGDPAETATGSRRQSFADRDRRQTSAGRGGCHL